VTHLIVNTQSLEWSQIREYIESRRADLVEQMDSLLVDDRDRRDAAVRRDELALLLAAPADAAQVGAAAAEASLTNRTIY
jgi:hypothetical protein